MRLHGQRRLRGEEPEGLAQNLPRKFCDIARRRMAAQALPSRDSGEEGRRMMAQGTSTPTERAYIASRDMSRRSPATAGRRRMAASGEPAALLLLAYAIAVEYCVASRTKFGYLGGGSTILDFPKIRPSR